MPPLASTLFASALTLVSAMSDAATPPTWETLPVEQPLPSLTKQGHLEHDGARIWFGTVGSGKPVILLHGGMASSQTWGNQIAALVKSHHQVILIDSRGHGRSTLGSYPLSYERMEKDVVATMDRLHIKSAAVVGWSDGAIIGLVMAMNNPERVSKVYAFGANMTTAGSKPDAMNAPILAQVGPRLVQNYGRVSGNPDGFAVLHEAVETMQKSQPNYATGALAAIDGPKVAIAYAEHDEFIRREHTQYLATTIPGAELIILPNVSHFAPWQDPAAFNASVLRFIDR